MTNSTNLDSMPPILEVGGVLRFGGMSHFAATYERELRSGRLTAIDTARPTLFATDDYILIITGETTAFSVVGQCVYRQGDVVGLELQIADAVQSQVEHALSRFGESEAKPQVQDSEDRVEDPMPSTNSVPTSGRHPAPTSRSDESDSGYAGLLLEPGQAGQSRGQSLDPPETIEAKPKMPQEMGSLDGEPPAAKRRQGPLRQAVGVADFLRQTGPPSLFRLLRELHRACTVGRLTVLTGEDFHSFELDARGCIHDFTADFGDWLKGQGLLKEDAARRLPRAVTVGETFTYLAENLQAFPELSVKILNRALLSQIVNTVRALNAIKGSRYVFEPLPRRPSKTLLNVPFVVYGAALMVDIVHETRAKALEAVFESKAEAYPRILQHEVWMPNLLKLDPQEVRFTEKFIPKGQTLRALIAMSPMSRRKTFNLLVVLVAFDMLEFTDTPPETAEGDDVFGRVQARLARCEEGHFQTLGIHITAHPMEIDAAFHEIKTHYSPTSEISRHSAATKTLCARLVERAEMSMLFLSNRENRIQYRSEIHTRTELVGFAQLLIDKLKIAILRENNKKIKRLHEVAMELAPRMVRSELRNLKSPEEGE